MKPDGGPVWQARAQVGLSLTGEEIKGVQMSAARDSGHRSEAAGDRLPYPVLSRRLR
jgi:hypothetical protein